ncbi:MAG: hypothetical protein JNL85_07345 [Rubrivivax sp.]|nr:hypothetical protein [Rubrivivax sp.]
MPATMIQNFFRPNPGVDSGAVLELTKVAARLWTRHGAQVSLWGVQVGENGTWVWTARFDSATKMGATLDALNNDPEFLAFRRDLLKAGLSTWVRGNQMFEIPL